MPFGIVKETKTTYSRDDQNVEQPQLTWFPVYAENYAYAHMLQGEILRQKYDYTAGNDSIEITYRYFCKEMIGRKQCEGIIQ